MSQLPPFTIKDLIEKPEGASETVSFTKEEIGLGSNDCDGMAPVPGSSTIDRVGWKDGTLKIKFKGVKPQIWEYTPVNEELFHSFMAKESKGRFFARYIKGNKYITPKRLA